MVSRCLHSLKKGAASEAQLAANLLGEGLGV